MVSPPHAPAPPLTTEPTTKGTTVIIILLCAAALFILCGGLLCLFNRPAAGIAIGALGFVCLFGLDYALATANDRYITITVTEKDRASKSDGGSSFRVATAEHGTFEVHDSLWYTQYRSDDIYRSLQPGRRYRVHTAGYRSGFMSWFPNIISAREIGPAK